MRFFTNNKTRADYGPGFFFWSRMLKNRGFNIFLMMMATSAILFVSLSGCAGNNDKPYKIGLLVPLSGNGRGSGEMHKALVSGLVDEINKAGGIDGHKVELFVEDTASDPAQTVISIKRLLEIDYVYAVLYPYHKGYSPAVAYDFNLGKTPVLIYGNPVIPEEQLNTWMILMEDSKTISNVQNSEDDSLIVVSEENTRKTFNLLMDGIKSAGQDKARARKFILESNQK